jgi:hypothetical protein
MKKRVVVIGGGPAGMLASGLAAEGGCDVTLLEKNERLGKKLFITGKGRCNLTNNSDEENHIANTPGNPYFMYSALYSFNSTAVMDFFENKLGVPLKTERGNRVFPKSDKSGDIVRALEKYVKKSGVKVVFNAAVQSVEEKDGNVCAVKIKGKTIPCDAVIVATGGLSYPMTGSTGDGYKFAKSLGHKVTKLYPSLVPLKVREKWVSSLMGLSLKNIKINVKIDNKTVYEDFGEMLFTHFGVSGPVILSASRYITERMNEKPELYIDLKPALSEKDLDKRLLKDFEKYANKDFSNALKDLLPQKLIPVIISLSGIEESKKVNVITKAERQKLLSLLKGLKLNITDTTGYNEAVVTDGGVCTDEIDPSTMQSKIVNGLYFAGEVIDVDAYTGGYNLQIAFSTAYLAGKSVSE